MTGATGSGPGRSVALTLAREGAQVVVNYRTCDESAYAIVEHIERDHGQAIATAADVFAADGFRHLVEAAFEHFGRVHICIVGSGGGWHPEPIDQLAPEAALEDPDGD